MAIEQEIRKKLVIIVLVLLVLLGSSLFVIQETSRAFLVRLGTLVNDRTTGKPKVITSGLHMKIPFIDQVCIFDTRLNMLDIKKSPILTLEKKYLLVDFFVQWKIIDLPLFFTRSKGLKENAQKFLEARAVETLRGEFGKRTIKEVVSGERVELMELLQQITNDKVTDLGIAVIDMRVKRIDLTDEISEAVFERMRAERSRVASEIRAEGHSEAMKIRADADKACRIILAEAERDAQKTRGDGDKEAFSIAANAFSQAPEFFELYRSLDAYKNSFKSKKDILVLTPNNNSFFRYFSGKNIREDS